MPMAREESTPRLQIHHQHSDKKHDMFPATSPKHVVTRPLPEWPGFDKPAFPGYAGLSDSDVAQVVNSVTEGW
jgi:hypothetical protein